MIVNKWQIMAPQKSQERFQVAFNCSNLFDFNELRFIEIIDIDVTPLLNSPGEPIQMLMLLRIGTQKELAPQ
jgi:hypothetical protein